MNNRQTRTPSRVQPAPIARGPQSHMVPSAPAPFPAAPNAALLIDFDNVTMGIRSELATELKNLLSSDIVQGKIAIRRAYADWRRYPQYVLPLTETSIDLIYAPAYGSAKKNATDIRLAIDAMELVFTRPEIGTIVLLSGDSDFSSLVIKLKEYGKYIIGVGIRESSSDLLVQNCDEYYSYNALAGLVKSGDEPVTKWDPWELASEAVTRMKRNGDVMRADRLKQVMQEIDSTFEEKNLKMAKFSRFVTEAAQRGILHVSKMDNGQLEVDLPRSAADAVSLAAAASSPVLPSVVDVARAAEPERESSRDRGRRGRRDRGRGRRSEVTDTAAAPAVSDRPVAAPAAAVLPAAATAPSSVNVGERLTRVEALELLRRAVDDLAGSSARPVPASKVREKARTLLGRDSETLSERHFARILQDAHDADVIDLRRRGDDYEVARVVSTATVAEQLGTAAASAAAAAAAAAPPPVAANRTMGARAGRAGFGKKLGEAPANLLSIGVVASTAPRASAVAPHATPVAPAAASALSAVGVVSDVAPKKVAGARKKAAGKTAKKTSAAAARKPAGRKKTPVE